MITIDEAIYFIKHCQKMFCWTGEVSSFHDVLTYLEDYKRLTDGDVMVKRLYAIQNISTGQIIFNARGGAYKKPEEAMAKLDKLEDGKYRIVTYELKGE